MKRRLETAEMWLYRRNTRIPWTEHGSNDELLKKMETKKDIYKNQIEPFEIPTAHNKERVHGKFGTHRTV